MREQKKHNKGPIIPLMILFALSLTIFFPLLSENTLANEHNTDVGVLEQKILNERSEKAQENINKIKGQEQAINKRSDNANTIFENNRGSITFINDTHEASKVAIGKGIVSVKDKKVTNAYVQMYVGEVNKTVGIYKSRNEFSSKKEVIAKGEFISLAETDSEGYVQFRADGFSTIIASLPDPVTTGIDSNRLELYNLNNFYDEYDTVIVNFIDPADGQAKEIRVSRDPFFNYFTTDWYTSDDFRITLSEGTDDGDASTGDFVLEFFTRTTNTNYNETIPVSVVALVRNAFTEELETATQDIDWTIADYQSTAGAPTIDTAFNSLYYLEDADTRFYIADFESYFSNFTSITTYTTDIRTGASVEVGPVVLTSNTFDSYTQDYIQFLLTDFNDVIDLEINEQTTAQDGDTYDITVEATNSAGSTQQNFDLQIVEEEPTGSVNEGDILSYYAFDTGSGTTAVDSVGNLDGTITLGTWTTGKISNSVRYDGSNDNVDLGTSNHLKKTGDFTITGWFNADVLTGGQILHFDWSGGDTNYIIDLQGSTLGMNSGDGSGDVEITYSGLSTSTWYQYAYVRDGNTLRMYLNGAEVNSTATGGVNGRVTANNVYIGGTGSSHFDGFIDEVGFWSVALTPAEISTLYAEGSPTSDQQYPFATETTTTPAISQLASFGTINLTGFDSHRLDLSGYFSNSYEEVNVSFADTIGSQSVFLSTTKDGFTTTHNSTATTVSLLPTGDNILLDLYSKNQSFEYNISISAGNTNNTIEDSFLFISNENITEAPEENFSSPPFKRQVTVANPTLDYNQSFLITTSDVFGNFSTAKLFYVNDDTNTTEDTQSIGFSNTKFTVEQVGNNFNLTNTNNETLSFNAEFFLQAINNNGTNTTGINFTLNKWEQPPAPERTVLQIVAENFGGLFPESTELTTSERLTYVAVTLILTMLAGILLIYNSEGTLLKAAAGILVSLVGIFELFFFVSIGYLGVIVIVTGLLLAVFIVYMLLKQTQVV